MKPGSNAWRRFFSRRSPHKIPRGGSLEGPRITSVLKWVRLFLPLLLLSSIYLLDIGFSHLLGDQTFAPVFCVLSLFGMAMCFSGRWILAWIPAFSVLAYWLIHDVSAYPLTRTTTVVLAGLMAAWASRQREKVDEQLGEIDSILLHLPTPWALLNEEGAIVKTNAAGASLLGSTPEDIVGNSIFEVGSAGPQERRRRIEDFMKVSPSGPPLVLALEPAASGARNIRASVFRLPTRRGKFSLLVFQPA